MLGTYIAILVLLCMGYIGSALGLFIYTDTKNRPHPNCIWMTMYFVSYPLMIFGCGLYFSGFAHLYHYQVVNINNQTQFSLEISNVCKTVACYGDCLSPMPISGVSCIKNILSNNRDSSCTSYCHEYYKKYAAIKQYTLQNLDEPDKIIIVSVKTLPMYDRVEDVNASVFPNLLNSQGYLSRNTDETVYGTIRWDSPSSYATKKDFGYVFMIVFGFLTCIAIVYMIVWYINNRDKLNYTYLPY